MRSARCCTPQYSTRRDGRRNATAVVRRTATWSVNPRGDGCAEGVGGYPYRQGFVGRCWLAPAIQ